MTDDRGHADAASRDTKAALPKDEWPAAGRCGMLDSPPQAPTPPPRR